MFKVGLNFVGLFLPRTVQSLDQLIDFHHKTQIEKKSIGIPRTSLDCRK
jgi:hypothetical protein